ncbi:MAG: hypothetical protein OQK04_19550 [Kangiellaceae bacterium]|nr:hypothetical protein [Kangiellaceae bacterium]MCW9000916.1 hypothetical protein [Kangiellaceae bacterium]
MKSTLCAITLLAAGALAGQTEAAPVSSAGWYYTTVNYYSGSPSFSHMGPYSDETSCEQARTDDYGDGGAIPWDGGPGCFELFENQIDAYNELLEHWGLAGGDDNGMPSVEAEMHEVLASVNVLIEQHAIREYRKSMSELSNLGKRQSSGKR